MGQVNPLGYPIYSCWGCPQFYKEKGSKYAVKHCGKDHTDCDYYWRGDEHERKSTKNHDARS